MATNQTRPKTKKLVIVRGRGTASEKRIETDITMYWCARASAWVTIPSDKK